MATVRVPLIMPRVLTWVFAEGVTVLVTVSAGVGCSRAGQANLVKTVLLHLIHGICNLLGFGLFIRLDLLHAWGISEKIGIVLRSRGKGAFGGVVAPSQEVFDGVHCVQKVISGLW